MSAALLEAVRALRVADPGLGIKPLLARLQEGQPDLGAGSKEVREALTALKAESEAKAATPAVAAAPTPADEGGAPAHAAPRLACVGCARMPSDMEDGREKYPCFPKCVKLKVPTTYFCGPNCSGNPLAWKVHMGYHKELKKQQIVREDGGVAHRRIREAAEGQVRIAAQTGDKYVELMAEGAQYASKQDWRRAARAYREGIALEPDRVEAYNNLGAMLSNSGHYVEAAQRFLEATERAPVGSEGWALTTATAFDMLQQEACDEVAKPEWWNDEGLKALSARVVRAAPNDKPANRMRAVVLCGKVPAWEAGPRSAADFAEAAVHYEQAATLCDAPAANAQLAGLANRCRSQTHEASSSARCKV